MFLKNAGAILLNLLSAYTPAKKVLKTPRHFW
jgi:hypothetical protein